MQRQSFKSFTIFFLLMTLLAASPATAQVLIFKNGGSDDVKGAAACSDKAKKNKLMPVFCGTGSHGTEPSSFAEALRMRPDFESRNKELINYIQAQLATDIREYVEQLKINKTNEADLKLVLQTLRSNQASLKGLSFDLKSDCGVNNVVATESRAPLKLCIDSALLTWLSYNPYYVSKGDNLKSFILSVALIKLGYEVQNIEAQKMSVTDDMIPLLISEIEKTYLVDASPSAVADEIRLLHKVDGKKGLLVKSKFDPIKFRLNVVVDAGPHQVECLNDVDIKTSAATVTRKNLSSSSADFDVEVQNGILSQTSLQLVSEADHNLELAFLELNGANKIPLAGDSEDLMSKVFIKQSEWARYKANHWECPPMTLNLITSNNNLGLLKIPSRFISEAKLENVANVPANFMQPEEVIWRRYSPALVTVFFKMP